MKKCFVNWYSARVAEQMESESSVSSINIHRAMSLVKPRRSICSLKALTRFLKITLNGFTTVWILHIIDSKMGVIHLETLYFAHA